MNPSRAGTLTLDQALTCENERMKAMIVAATVTHITATWTWRNTNSRSQVKHMLL